MPRKPHTEWPDDLQGNVSALPGERRKTFGMLDEALLDRVDAEAHRLGQTRREYTERALRDGLPGGTLDRLRGCLTLWANLAPRDLLDMAPGPNGKTLEQLTGEVLGRNWSEGVLDEPGDRRAVATEDGER